MIQLLSLIIVTIIGVQNLNCAVKPSDEKITTYVELLSKAELDYPASFNYANAKSKLAEAIESVKSQVKKTEAIDILNKVQSLSDTLLKAIDKVIKDNNYSGIFLSVITSRRNTFNRGFNLQMLPINEKRAVNNLLSKLIAPLSGLEKKAKSLNK